MRNYLSTSPYKSCHTKVAMYCCQDAHVVLLKKYLVNILLAMLFLVSRIITITNSLIKYTQMVKSFTELILIIVLVKHLICPTNMATFDTC